MTMTRWRERGLVAHWLKMAAICLIGLENFRRQFSVGRDAGWREIIETLSGAREFCYGKLCLPRLIFVSFIWTINSLDITLCLHIFFFWIWLFTYLTLSWESGYTSFFHYLSLFNLYLQTLRLKYFQHF